MAADLSGQVALVTGRGRGIGRSIALTLAKAGARFFLAVRSADQLAGVAKEIRSRGGEAEYAAVDLSRVEASKRFLVRCGRSSEPSLCS